MINEYVNALNKCKANFKGASALDIEFGRKPGWVANSSLDVQYREKNLLIQFGQIVYGVLVEANVQLFSPGANNCPAVFLFSSDEFFNANPKTLADLASEIFNLKNSSSGPAYFSDTAALIKNEMAYFYNFKIPPAAAKNRAVYMSTVLAVRKHLPGKMICGRLLPLLTDPARCASSFVVPFQYWGEELKQLCDRRVL